MAAPIPRVPDDGVRENGSSEGAMSEKGTRVKIFVPPVMRAVRPDSEKSDSR